MIAVFEDFFQDCSNLIFVEGAVAIFIIALKDSPNLVGHHVAESFNRTHAAVGLHKLFKFSFAVGLIRSGWLVEAAGSKIVVEEEEKAGITDVVGTVEIDALPEPIESVEGYLQAKIKHALAKYSFELSEVDFLIPVMKVIFFSLEEDPRSEDLSHDEIGNFLIGQLFVVVTIVFPDPAKQKSDFMVLSTEQSFQNISNL